MANSSMAGTSFTSQTGSLNHNDDPPPALAVTASSTTTVSLIAQLCRGKPVGAAKTMLGIFAGKASRSTSMAERKERLAGAVLTDDVQKARTTTIMLATEWAGKGLHVLQAIKNLASFGGSDFELAVDIFMATVIKYVKLNSGVPGFWKSARKDHGNAARYFKAFDRTFVLILSKGWSDATVANNEQTFQAEDILGRTRTLVQHIISRRPKTRQGTLPYVHPHRSINLPASRCFLSNTRHRIYGVMLSRKVAGHRIPQEIVDIIAAEIAPYNSISLHCIGHFPALSSRDQESQRKDRELKHRPETCWLCGWMAEQDVKDTQVRWKVSASGASWSVK